jgi:hypothetical protein
MISLLELQKEVHQTALDKGWWEEDRNVGEMIALVHSEISEAHEAADENRFETTFSNGKPEGFYIECADVVIRVLDLGHVAHTFEESVGNTRGASSTFCDHGGGYFVYSDA